jgi:RNA-binding protein YhbY
MTSHLNCSIQIHDLSLELSERSYICILRFTWEVMYLYTTVQVRGHVSVYYGSSERTCICILRFKWEVMYLYTTVQLRGHVFVYYGWSERLCICILRLKWAVMYLYTTVQVRGHVFVYYGSSERSCICILRFMSLTWTIVYKYITAHLNRSIQMNDLSLEP